MKLFHHLFGALALLASTACASPVNHSPQDGITYQVGIPPSTASGGSGGDIYLQLSAASGYRWIALGIGKGMTGATIFVMYADGAGNVTISPRKGTGHVEPQYDSSAQVELLAGSGVVNGAMTANVRYTPPSGLLSYSSTSSGWICSWQSGSALNSKSPSATITQHDAHDVFTFDLTKAAIASDTNPYVPSSSETASGTGTGAPVSIPTSGSSDSSSGSSSVTDPSVVYQQSHGIIMATSMVVLFPLGAIVLQVFGGVWIHAGIQMFGLIAILVGLGLGLKLAQLTNLLFNTAHTVFGVIIVALFIVQPLLGILHHRQYMRMQKRSHFGFSHIWYGRILIICGIVNGGLGLQLADNSNSGEIIYAVVAGVLFIAYLGALLYARFKAKKEVKSEQA